MKKYNVAILGATGAVGREMLKMTGIGWNLRVMKLLDAAMESAETKKRVEIRW